MRAESDVSSEGSYLAKVREAMKENREADDELAKARLKAKRIKAKVRAKAARGDRAEDLQAVLGGSGSEEYGSEGGAYSGSDQSSE